MISLIAEYQFEDALYILPGLFGTLSLIVVNMIPLSFVNQPHLYTDNTCCGSLMIKTCLLIGFMISFGTIIGACYILFNDYILDQEEQNKWPGYGIFLHNLFIFIAAVLLRCRKSYDNF
ncbi:UPF0220 domain containing protein [Asbolus verrucosus]|uniref:UPF0220 domain containing protein n=1 Tax=Asbolus verrucosus TaxID=1661398 RepID=A0A482W9U6_ASBVE|nr:UPF0220 domain containing protein [Asbolus verrucosus]